MSLRILGCILIVFLGTQAFPQRQRESSDFNYNGKASEKTLRSLDQISLQDGTIRGRSSYTDSYGNPVAYDSLDDVNAKKPSNNKLNPNQYVIPGYASGILQPHEVPTRGASIDDDEGRKINDDKIHFVDPLHPNSFQSVNNKPSTSLTVPGINLNSQSPIEIPRPNIDLPETPISPLDDPSSNPLSPPLDSNLPNAPLSTILELPLNHNSDNQQPFLTGLVPPQIPDVNGVEIPKPNLDAHETPIDDNRGSLSQGLLPPTSVQPNFANNPFLNPTLNGPVVITDEQTVFAPKPANGLLPPKDPLPNNIDFQTGTTNNNVLTSSTTSSKFAGTFEGTLGGGITTTASPVLIPVQVIQTKDDGKVDKYTGGFGGSPGILVSNNPADRIVSTQVTRIQQTISANSIPPTRATNIQNKFTGTFGGSIGVLNPGNSPVGAASTIQNVQTVTQHPITQANNLSFLSNNKKVSLFGGPEGVLRPFDNLQKQS